MPEPFFDEPQFEDATYAIRGETDWDFLHRSTVARAVDCRRFLNEHISKLPNQNQSAQVHELKIRWQSAFFELMVARLMQELGAELSIEQENVDGRRPDFSAQFSDVSIVVEANSPVIDSKTQKIEKDRIPLLNYIESKIPDNWAIGVFELPSVGENDSKREFKGTVDQMIQALKDTDAREPIELLRITSQGVIRLSAWPSDTRQKRLLSEGFSTSMDTTHLRISAALTRKRRQVRNSAAPVLLALEASGISSDFDTFDRVLFGAGVAQVDVTRQLINTSFRFDGAFSRNWNSDTAPTYAGVIGFLGTGFHGFGFKGNAAPVLFRHPRFAGLLPTALDSPQA